MIPFGFSGLFHSILQVLRVLFAVLFIRGGDGTEIFQKFMN